jgi:hypothetical protein
MSWHYGRQRLLKKASRGPSGVVGAITAVVVTRIVVTDIWVVQSCLLYPLMNMGGTLMKITVDVAVFAFHAVTVARTSPHVELRIETICTLTCSKEHGSVLVSYIEVLPSCTS